MAVVDRAILLTCSHTVKSLQLQYHTVHTHGPERNVAATRIRRSRLVAVCDTAWLLLHHCGTPRWSIRANHHNVFRPRAAGFCPAVSGLSVVSACVAPPSPRHWPHFAEGSPHRIAHTGGRVDWTLNTSILQSAWVTPTICGHLAAVWMTQWIVITVALWWVPPPTVGAIAGWVVGFRCRIQTEQRCLVGRYANKDVQVRRPGLQVYRP